MDSIEVMANDKSFFSRFLRLLDLLVFFSSRAFGVVPDILADSCILMSSILLPRIELTIARLFHYEKILSWKDSIRSASVLHKYASKFNYVFSISFNEIKVFDGSNLIELSMSDLHHNKKAFWTFISLFCLKVSICLT